MRADLAGDVDGAGGDPLPGQRRADLPRQGLLIARGGIAKLDLNGDPRIIRVNGLDGPGASQILARLRVFNPGQDRCYLCTACG